MKVKLAKTAGFCMGVRRAMELVLTEANKKDEGPLCTFGPLIHNSQVLDLLENKGVRVVDGAEGAEQGRVVIRAHGIPPTQRKRLKESRLRILDATCPKVARVQGLIRVHTRKGHECIIVGDRDHAEVIGLMGYSESPPFVIQDARQARDLPPLSKPFVVAQTTQNEAVFHEVVSVLRARFPNLIVFETICDATRQRQEEVRSFKGQVDAMVIVGGYHSGNTRRLTEIARESGLAAFHVETEKDLDPKALESLRCIGVTAGASTPNWMIQNVVRAIQGIRSNREGRGLNLLRQSLEALVLSNTLVAAAAFCFAYAAARLSGAPPEIVFPIITMLYIYAVHGLNRYVDKGASVYNDPAGARFLAEHRRLLISTELLALLTALGLASMLGWVPFLSLAAFIFVGLLYSLPIVPDRFRTQRAYARIKDLPGSRSLAEALARVAVINLLPLLSGREHGPWVSVGTSMLFVFFLSYVRSGLFDLFHLQGDLIVGKETLPLTIGARRTTVLLRGMLLFVTACLLGVALAGLVQRYACLMLLPVMGMGLCLAAYEKGWLHSGTRMEACVEGNLFLAGLIAFLAQLF